MPIKKTQGGPGAATNGIMKPSGCIALEAQDWSDGINQYVQFQLPQFYHIIWALTWIS